MNIENDYELVGLVPNLDDFVLPREVAEQKEKFKQLSKDFKNLARYCEAKEDAMCLRLYGKVQDAIKLERVCEEIYETLPSWARW